MRAWILTLEAAFTYTFWTVWQAEGKLKEDHYMGQVCPWEDVEWKGLASHSPLAENVVGIELSTEELLAKLEKRRADQRAYYWANREACRERNRNYAPRRRELRQFSESYQKELARGRESRAMLRKVEAGEIEMDEDVSDIIEYALRYREHGRNKYEKHKDRWAAEMRESSQALRKVMDGLLDAEDPIVQKLIRKAEVSRKATYKYREKHRDAINARDRELRKISSEALHKVETGELNAEDSDIQKLIKKAVTERAQHAKQKENKDELNARAKKERKLNKDVLEKFENGELDEEDESVQKALDKKAKKSAGAKRCRDKEREALEKYELGELDSEDELVQRALRNKRKKSEDAQKRYAEKKKRLSEGE